MLLKIGGWMVLVFTKGLVAKTLSAVPDCSNFSTAALVSEKCRFDF